MGDVSDFLAMGGYAAFVWPAYAVAAVVLIALLITSLRAYRSREAELRLAERDRENRRAGRTRRSGGASVGAAGEGEIRT